MANLDRPVMRCPKCAAVAYESIELKTPHRDCTYRRKGVWLNARAASDWTKCSQCGADAAAAMGCLLCMGVGYQYTRPAAPA